MHRGRSPWAQQLGARLRLLQKARLLHVSSVRFLLRSQRMLQAGILRQRPAHIESELLSRTVIPQQAQRLCQSGLRKELM